VKPFLERVQEGLLLFDGAVGTMLQSWGLPVGEAPERWVFDKPDQVLRLHRAYVEAGAEALTTDTFGGTKFKLATWTDTSRVYELNRRAAELAREAAGDRVYVAGSVGPTGVFLAPLGEVSEQEMFEAFAEQVRGLVDGGVDLIIIETQMDVNEAKLALRAVREVGRVPVVANMTYDPGKAGFRTLMGATVEQCVRALDEAGADVLGTNCGTGISDMIEIVREMRRFTEKPILAEPNAGLPVLEGGKTVYKETAQEMADRVPDLVAAGAQIVGGCCGTTPEHIRLFRQKLAGL